MEDWDAQKMLDRYIHDYMIKKNMKDAAAIFAEETNICSGSVVGDSPEGFLSDWWSIFWDVFSEKLSNHPEATRGSSSKIAGDFPQNSMPVFPSPNMNYLVQNTLPEMQFPGFPNQLQTVHSKMPRPDMVNLLQNAHPTTMLRPDVVNLLQIARPKNIPRTDMMNFLQNSLPTTVPRQDMMNLLQTALPTTMPRPDMVNLLQSGLPTTMPVPEMMNLLQTSLPRVIPRPDMMNLLHTSLPTTIPRPDMMNLLHTSLPTTIPRPDMMNLLRTTLPTTISMPDMMNLLQSDLPATMQRPNMMNLLQNPPATAIPRPDMMNLRHSNLPGTEMVNYLRSGHPAMMPTPGMVNMLQNTLPTIMPELESKLNGLELPPNLEFNVGREQSQTDLMNSIMCEQGNHRLPANNFDTNSQLLNVDLLARMPPSSSKFRHPPCKIPRRSESYDFTNKRVCTDLWGSLATETGPHGESRAIPHNVELDDPGRNEEGKQVSSERSPSSEFNLAINTQLPNQHQEIPVSASILPQDNMYDSAGQTSQEKMSPAFGSSINQTSSINLVDNGINENYIQLQKGKNVEVVEPLDQNVKYFSSEEGTAGVQGYSFSTLPFSSSPQDMFQPEEFRLQTIGRFCPTYSGLVCCDISAEGNLVAAAGMQQTVFIWNPAKSTLHSFKGHSQLVTNVRFRPDSTNLASSSHDGSVRIWDVTKRKRSLLKLVGHTGCVMSVDYHPTDINLLCSCDSNDGIRLWNIDQSYCVHTFKGGNRQVRFQPQSGNVLAAAKGNVINLIDLETNTICCQLEGHMNHVNSMCWDRSGMYLASASDDSVRIWSFLNGGKCVHELHSSDHNKFSSCTFHPAYSFVLAVGSDKIIYIWDPTAGKRTFVSEAHNDAVLGLTSSTQANTMVSVSHDKWIKLWK